RPGARGPAPPRGAPARRALRPGRSRAFPHDGGHGAPRALPRAARWRHRAHAPAAVFLAPDAHLSYYRSGAPRGGWGGGAMIGFPPVTPYNKGLMIACGAVWIVQFILGPVLARM